MKRPGIDAVPSEGFHGRGELDRLIDPFPGAKEMRLGLALTLLLQAPALAAVAQEATEYASARAGLVAQVELNAELAGPVTGHPVIAPSVLEAIREVPRHLFVPEAVAAYAYLDLPLPAAFGLRESQPFLVALMSDLVDIQAGDDVLVLGVGGGYHAAVASRLAARVHAVDLDAAAATAVEARLGRLGYGNVEVRSADPYDGWPEAERTFDAIIVRLAVDRLPQALLRQLAPGGRLVAPIGPAESEQSLMLVIRRADGSLGGRSVLPVRFMRLPGGERI
jgi:protein-L-isoaspartate(D-aspartate) O-methyltransferase